MGRHGVSFGYVMACCGNVVALGRCAGSFEYVMACCGDVVADWGDVGM